VKPGTEPFFALGVLNEALLHLWKKEGGDSRKAMLRSWLSYQGVTTPKVAEFTGVDELTIKTIGREFASAKRPLAIGSGVAGSATNATATWVAAYLLTAITGSLGKTVDFGRIQNVDCLTPFTQVVSWLERLKKGDVDVLLVYQANPAYTLPKSAGFSEALKKVPWVVSFSNFWDETTTQADLILPDHHPLESFGDYSPQTGVHGLYQPAMRPIFQTQQIGDTLLSVAAAFPSSPFKEGRYLDYLKTSWNALYSKSGQNGSLESFWQESLKKGGYWQETSPKEVSISNRLFTFKVKEPALEGEGEYHLVVYPSSKFYDGRGANKPWLQEIPDPVTKVVWNSYVEIHPEVAEKLEVRHGSVVELRLGEASLKGPVLLNPWIQKETVAIPLGQGHEEYGRYAKGRGFNPLSILPLQVETVSGGFAWTSSRVQMAPTGERVLLVKTSGSIDDRNRDIAGLVSFEDLKTGKAHREEEDIQEKLLYDESWRHEKGVRWAMAIDSSSCTGCSACVAACYAENNIPIVGEQECAKGREMAWIRIETYEEPDGPHENGGTHPVNVPMMCQQCGNAPCESVCPVYATYHNYEGLNVQVYNRCVGTRYCSNNCPYKVRRFNWFAYKFPDPFNLQLNPDVTVRDKGVMEKCTFCIQRIREVKDHAKDEGRLPRDGEIVPACAQTCPTNAIVFGDLNDHHSKVAQLARSERGYHAIEPINTKTAITYLKKIHNGLRTA
jgi:molybdopterin-containing oxidoreductase family iron-sulfur binding subunit